MKVGDYVHVESTNMDKNFYGKIILIRQLVGYPFVVQPLGKDEDDVLYLALNELTKLTDEEAMLKRLEYE
jgi:hypothetical protein